MLTRYSAFFNNITYVAPKVPILYTAMTTGADAVNPAVYGEFSHPYVLEKGQTIEIVVNNLGKSSGPNNRRENKN
jgi:iron transport multicopper oxidase